MRSEEKVEISKEDLVAAWSILENLAVSLHQIGSAFAVEDRPADARNSGSNYEHALAAYLTPDLVEAINQTRCRLAEYLTEEEAETLSEQIKYFNDQTVSPTSQS